MTESISNGQVVGPLFLYLDEWEGCTNMCCTTSAPVSRNKVSPITQSPGGGNISSPPEEIFPGGKEIFPLPRRKYFLPSCYFPPPL